MGKRNIVEKGMTQNMERINEGRQMGEDRKPVGMKGERLRS
jgi:hypothetical protein